MIFHQGHAAVTEVHSRIQDQGMDRILDLSAEIVPGCGASQGYDPIIPVAARHLRRGG
jgi:hypothetical protein